MDTTVFSFFKLTVAVFGVIKSPTLLANKLFISEVLFEASLDTIVDDAAVVVARMVGFAGVLATVVLAPAFSKTLLRCGCDEVTYAQSDHTKTSSEMCREKAT